MNQVLIPMIHAFYSFSFIQLQFPSSSIKLVPQRFVLLYSNIGISKEIAFINVPVFSFSAKTILNCVRACCCSAESKRTSLCTRLLAAFSLLYL